MVNAQKLSPRRQRFVDEYLVDMNGVAAYLRAGFASRNAAAAASGAHRLLKVDAVAEAIAERMAARQQRTEISQDRVLNEYARIAFFDPRRLFHPDGRLKKVLELDADSAAVLTAMDVAELAAGEGSTIRKVKLLDKKAALDSLARHLGLFNDKQTVKHELEELTDAELDARIAMLSSDG
ncbi:terminase small subunit [Chitinimonas viridis]|uniref:Terminase small subunit n=1 Tax=Chitinimonas viridis TaxID=664880 RepID=A0ABT8B1X2_9NEIS|nr:terminase small subunit [Chitinimonas viridis]MDN3575877.1 terminase small subunit [Chitinimonas viridis]